MTEAKMAVDDLLSRYANLMRLFRHQLYTDIDERVTGWRARINLRLTVEEVGCRPNLANALMALDFREHGAGAGAELSEAIAKARAVIAAETELVSALDRLYSRVERNA